MARNFYQSPFIENSKKTPMEDIFLNKICEAAKNGELAIICGSRLLGSNPWQQMISTFWDNLARNTPDLAESIEEIRNRDISPEALFRIMHSHLKKEMLELFQGFQASNPHPIYLKLATLVRHHRISYLGTSAIDNQLRLALAAQNLESGHDYNELLTNEEGKLPLVFWLNSDVQRPASFEAMLNLPANAGLDKHALQFLRRMKKAKAILILGAGPGEFCWRSLYGQLLEISKKNVPIYWASSYELIPLTHITSICNGGLLKQSPANIIDALLEGITLDPNILEESAAINSSPNISEETSHTWDYITDFIKKNDTNWSWHFLTAVWLNHVVSRAHSMQLFDMLLKVYQKAKSYAMIASCYRHLGKIFYEQGFLERAIEHHIKAISHWAAAQDSLSMAEEYTLCADNYRNGAATEKACQYFGEALSLYRQIHYLPGIAEVAYSLGLVCDEEEDYGLARQYYLESQQSRHAMQDGPNEIITLLSLGSTLNKIDAFDEARAYLEKAIELCQNYEDSVGLGEAYQLFGMVCAHSEDNAKAREYYEKARTLYQAEQDEISLTSVYSSLGQVCAKLEDYDNAIQYYEDSVVMHEKIGDWPHLAGIYTNLGVIYCNSKEYHLAEEYFAHCEEIFAALSDVYNLIRTHQHLAKIYVIQNQLDNAIECYRANIEMLVQLNKKDDLAENLVALAMVYLQNQDFDDCTENLRRALTIYQSLGKEEAKISTEQILAAVEEKKANLSSNE